MVWTNNSGTEGLSDLLKVTQLLAAGPHGVTVEECKEKA